MWSRIFNSILAVLLIVLLILLTLQLLKTSKLKVEKANLEKELYYCQHAPIVSDTVRDIIRIVEYITIKPKPKPLPEWSNTGLLRSVPEKCKEITPTYYSETYKSSNKLDSQGVVIKWEAQSECINDSSQITFIRFPEILAPKEIITVTKTVLDTIKLEVPTKLGNKFLVCGELGANNFNSFPVIGVGVGILYKQNWFLTVGGMYLDTKAYGVIKVGITF